MLHKHTLFNNLENKQQKLEYILIPKCINMHNLKVVLQIRSANHILIFLLFKVRQLL